MTNPKPQFYAVGPRRRRMLPQVSTSRRGTLYVAPRHLFEALGSTDLTDDYKVSKEWKFLDDDGHLYTVYDYKKTDLYSHGYPSEEEFWESECASEFSIGGQSDVDQTRVNEFIEWLHDKVLGIDD